MSYITGAASLVEPGLDVLFVYNIRYPSGNRYLAGDASPHHTHLKPTIYTTALALTYRSLRRSRRSIRNSCQRKLECLLGYTSET
jgi:hypothetical protein